jgi:hypothetical protein
MRTDSIYIEDFNGYLEPGHLRVSFWADYHPATGHTVYGGDWCGVPDLITRSKPSLEQVHAHAKLHMQLD